MSTPEPEPVLAVESKSSNSYVTKRQFIVGGAIVGVALALALVAVTIIALAVNRVQEESIQNNRDRIADIKREQERLDTLLNPTPEQYRRRLREGIERCLREPECRRLFPKIARSTAPAGPPGSRQVGVGNGSDTPVRSPESPRTRPRPERSPRAPRPDRPDSQPDGGNGGGGSSSPPAPPPDPPRAIELDAPVPAQVCIDRVLGINC